MVGLRVAGRVLGFVGEDDVVVRVVLGGAEVDFFEEDFAGGAGC